MVRNDAFAPTAAGAAIAPYDGVLLSPGPGAPAAAGVSIPIVHAAIAAGVPLLGVCLGHQAIAEALGATVDHADELMHGQTSLIHHDGGALYAGVPQPFRATRYHSLAVVDTTIPDALRVTARTTGGVVMGLEHRTAPVVGVQFHPESVLTEGGMTMVGNWVRAARSGTEARDGLRRAVAREGQKWPSP